MKKCKSCQSEIDNKAKVCPKCNKKQGMPIWAIILLIIGAILIISSLFSSNESEEEQKGNTTTEKLTLLDNHSGQVGNYSWTYEITGTIQNNTDKDYSYVSVEFYIYDAEDNLLDTCLGNNSGLEANGKWKFTASCYFENSDADKVTSYKLKEISGW